MADLGIWKLCLDGAMVVALAFLGVKMLRSSGVSETNLEYLRELDSSLKRLLKEADRSAAELGQSLAKQKSGLEELLFDVETVENRLNKAIDDAQSARKQLTTGIARAKESRNVAEPAAKAATPEQYIYDLPEEPYSISDSEPASFGSPAAREVPPPRAQQLATARNQSVNIFGDPIETPAAPKVQNEVSTTPAKSGTLRDSIVKEVVPPAPVSAPLEDVYAAAESLLNTGKTLEQVAAMTKLPVEEVRMLSQVIASESEEMAHTVSADDARLGVLSKGIRRERQVL